MNKADMRKGMLLKGKVGAQEKIYSYIGLATKDGIKNIDMQAKDFAGSLFEISKGNKKKLWKQIIDILESDNTFIDLNIKKWSEECEDNVNELPSECSTESLGADRKRILKEGHADEKLDCVMPDML